MKNGKVSNPLRITRDEAGKVVTRTGMCTGIQVGGIEYGIMAKSKADLKEMCDLLNIAMVKGTIKRATWVKQEHYERFAGTPESPKEVARLRRGVA